MIDSPLPPGSTIGILGGGQLGRMLSLAAAKLGFDVAVLEPEPVSPAGRVSSLELSEVYDDEDALQVFAGICDVVTFEFENVPALALERLKAFGTETAPGPRALAVTQDRVDEKRFLNGVGVETVAFEAIDAAVEIPEALQRLGAPALLKTRREGYDGKGQSWINNGGEAAVAWNRIGRVPSILEAKASFVRELSIIAARGRDGAMVFYPVGQNTHEDGILRRTLAPAPDAEALQPKAEAIARKVLEGLDYVGVMGVELFELPGGRLLVNELAPRVHNTGHWTQDGCACDQFEQHIRAVAGWPLVNPGHYTSVEMENLLGDEVDRWAEIAQEPNARLHLYGKGDARPGRKMGHVNRIRS